MRLARISIHDFRGIADLTLTLDPRLTVLIGDNAAGKTTVLDAIALALSPIVTRCPNARGLDFRASDLRRVNGKVRPYAFIRAESTAGVLWDRRKLRDETALTKTMAAKQNPRKGTRRLFAEIDPAIAARAGGDSGPPLPVVAYYGTERAVVVPPLRKRAFRDELDAFEAFRGALSPTASFKAVFEWFLAAESDELREQRNRRQQAWQNPQLAAVRSAVEAVLPGAKRLRVESKPLRMMVTLTNAQKKVEDLTLQELSGGYRTMLALVADLARRMAQANPEQGTASEAVVLIDEVDLHLHPRWQQGVLDALLKAFPNAQFVVSTHSEQVVGAVAPEQIVALDQAPGGISATAPSSTYGATPDRISQDVMGLSTLRHPDVDRALRRYWQEISEGRGESTEANALRAKLDAWFRGQDPEIIRADAEIRRQKMLKKLKATKA